VSESVYEIESHLKSKCFIDASSDNSTSNTAVAKGNLSRDIRLSEQVSFTFLSGN
jgi:hypothetical protein